MGPTGGGRSGAERVVVVGAGAGGLAAAALLAARGLDVTVFDRAARPGGKVREVEVGGRCLDAGPTVFTMRWVFEELFAECGDSLADRLALAPAEVLARHAWDGGAPGDSLDLYADPARSEDAIGRFAGAAEARGYRGFLDRARRAYRAMERPFIRAADPSPLSVAAAAGPWGMADLMAASPFGTLWGALGAHFRDPRLRQLFGRYATYCGASPYEATASLMLVAHVEGEGVWLVEGGMARLADALAALAASRGAAIRCGEPVAEVLAESGRASGVRLASGERVAADAVVLNADAGSVAGGALGPAAAAALPAALARGRRSLSALTWTTVAQVEGFPLSRHTVFFSRDYAAEFEAIFGRARLPGSPTVYVCAQDRGASAGEAPPPGAPERLLILVNAPAAGDARPFDAPETEPCETATFALMRRCGLEVRPAGGAATLLATTPRGWESLYPGTGGALYGPPPHGWAASFARPKARTALPGLLLAGGGAHPGAGVPMAAMSGRLAAAALLADLEASARRRSPRPATGAGWPSTAPSRPTATPGGTSTR